MTEPLRGQSLSDVIDTIQNGVTCAILVESNGKASDAQILQVILKSIGKSVTFHGRGGRDTIINELPHFVKTLPQYKVAAIVDRDFTDDSEVEATYLPDYAGHLFYWRRYSIENYLLEPDIIVSCLEMTCSLQPSVIPIALATPESAEHFLLEWCQRLAPQVAGNWTIHELTTEPERERLDVAAPAYFEGLVERDPAWVLEKLHIAYSQASEMYPALFGSQVLAEQFENKLDLVVKKIKTLKGCYEIVDGKRFLKRAILSELPPNLRGYFFSILTKLASINPPSDMQLLVEDRILPRWRKAKAASQA